MVRIWFGYGSDMGAHRVIPDLHARIPELDMPRRASGPDKLVRALPVPDKGATITYHADVPGFGARVTANGARSFVLNYMSTGRERRMTIGQFPTWSATAAREEARTLRRKVDSGIDPMAEGA
jgi:hypothetical protein